MFSFVTHCGRLVLAARSGRGWQGKLFECARLGKKHVESVLCEPRLRIGVRVVDAMYSRYPPAFHPRLARDPPANDPRRNRNPPATHPPTNRDPPATHPRPTRDPPKGEEEENEKKEKEKRDQADLGAPNTARKIRRSVTPSLW